MTITFLKRLLTRAGRQTPAEEPTVTAVTPDPWDAPAPVLLNPWKHHGGALRRRIAAAARDGDRGLGDLAGRLVVIGTELMDLYLGALPPAVIGRQLLDQLRPVGRFDPEPFAAWLADGGGYQVLTLPDDGSRWVLRQGEAGGRYVHVHPGRYSPQTRRVRANVLKTAVLALAHVAVHGGDPTDRALVNLVRQRHLGLAPVGHDITGEQGLGGVLDALRKS